MFGFLAPMALSALALLAVPILLHLFTPRKVRQVPFSSLRWLRASQHRLSKKIRWHQVMLLMLRVGFIAAVVLALAVPVFTWHGGGQWEDRFIVLDVGQGMGAPGADGVTPLERGKQAARWLIDHVSTGDRTAALSVGAGVQSAGPMVHDASAYLASFQTLRPSDGDTRLTDVLRLVAPLRQAGKHRGRSIVLDFITNNASGKWSQSDIHRFMAGIAKQAHVPVKVNIIDVGPNAVENAWIADARLVKTGASGRRVIRARVGAAGTSAQTRTLHLILAGVAEQTRRVTLEPGSRVQVQFELPPDVDVSGQVARLVLTPSDDRPADDTHWINLDTTLATRVLVIEPHLTDVAELQPAYHLRTALRIVDETSPARIEVVRLRPDDVLDEQIGRADVIIMTDVPELARGDLQKLEKRVRQGAGLAVFLGPAVKRQFYNNRLHDPQHPSSSLSPVRLGELVQARVAPSLIGIRWNHPLFRGLSDPHFGDLRGAWFSRYFQWERDPAVEKAHVLASIGEAQPAVVERPFGAGRVLLFNTTANDAWSNLPRRHSYVPMIARMVRYLAGGWQTGTFTIGSRAMVRLPFHVSQPKVEVRAPDGSRLTPVLGTAADRSTIRFGTFDQAGVYEITVCGEGDTHRFPIVVEPAPRGHDLARLPADMLEAWWAPAKVRVVQPESLDSVISGSGMGWRLTPWLLALACALLAAEMFFVHRLCPSVNRPLAEAAIHRRGFFARSDDDGAPASADRNPTPQASDAYASAPSAPGAAPSPSAGS